MFDAAERPPQPPQGENLLLLGVHDWPVFGVDRGRNCGEEARENGRLEPKHVVFPLRARLRRTVVRQAEVRAVDLSRCTVLASHCPACRVTLLPFDHLVLAIGSVTNFFQRPDVAAHALPLKSLADASTLHGHVVDKFEHAEMEDDPASRRELPTNRPEAVDALYSEDSDRSRQVSGNAHLLYRKGGRAHGLRASAALAGMEGPWHQPLTGISSRRLLFQR